MDQVDHHQQLVDAPPGGFGVQALDGRHVFEKLDCCQVGVDAEILRQVAQHSPQAVRRFEHVTVVPPECAFSGLGDGDQDAHQGGLAGAVWPEQASDARTQLQVEVAQPPEVAAVLFGEVGYGEFHFAPW